MKANQIASALQNVMNPQDVGNETIDETAISASDAGKLARIVSSGVALKFEKQISGELPLIFNAARGYLSSWTLLGNGSQTGTPTPDAPIQPTFCGVWTEQIFDIEGTLTNGNAATLSRPDENTLRATATGTGQNSYRGFIIPNPSALLGKTVTISAKVTASAENTGAIRFYWMNGIAAQRLIGGNTAISGDYKRTFTFPDSIYSGCDGIGILFSANFDGTAEIGDYVDYEKVMLNSGSTALPYEPYGYKIPITNAGQTVPVYLGEVPTVRRVKKIAFDGTEGWTENTSGENTFRARLVLSQANINSVAGYCSHLPFVATGISQDIPLAGCYNSAAFLRFDRTMVNNITDFKSYLAAQYAAGTPVTVWYVLAEPETAVVNEPLAKIGNYADELFDAAQIPTKRGPNTLTVGTTVQPSFASIIYPY